MKNPPNNDMKTLRGGSWDNDRDDARADNRYNDPSDFRFDDSGLRVLEELSNGSKSSYKRIRGGSWYDFNIGFRVLEELNK